MPEGPAVTYPGGTGPTLCAAGARLDCGSIAARSPSSLCFRHPCDPVVRVTGKWQGVEPGLGNHREETTAAV